MFSLQALKLLLVFKSLQLVHSTVMFAVLFLEKCLIELGLPYIRTGSSLRKVLHAACMKVGPMVKPLKWTHIYFTTIDHCSETIPQTLQPNVMTREGSLKSEHDYGPWESFISAKHQPEAVSSYFPSWSRSYDFHMLLS